MEDDDKETSNVYLWLGSSFYIHQDILTGNKTFTLIALIASEGCKRKQLSFR